MIRQATKYDKEQIKEMMIMFQEESGIDHLLKIKESDYWHNLIDNILAGQGIIFLEENVGFIMGIVFPSIWSDKIYGLHELAWYVKPGHRYSRVGYHLIQQYIQYAKKQKEIGRIEFFTLSKLPYTDVNYSKLGFKKMDENWIQ